MKTWVAIGSSTARDYAFLLPMTCLFWKKVIGHDPIAFLVGREWFESTHQNQQARLVHQLLHELDIEHVMVGSLETKGHSDGTFAQNVRHHAAALSRIAPEEWVMLADADLWPLRPEYYHRHDGFTGRAVCLNSNTDHFFGKKDVLAKFDAGGGFQAIPTCHVIMRAADWRSAYQMEPNDDVPGATLATLERMQPWLKQTPAKGFDLGFSVWCCDQWYVTERLCRQEWFPDFPIPHPCPPGGRTLGSENVLLVERYGHPPVDRLDRGIRESWTWKFDPNRWIDSHVFKDPTNPDHWQLMQPVLETLLPADLPRLRQFYAEYTGAAT